MPKIKVCETLRMKKWKTNDKSYKDLQRKTKDKSYKNLQRRTKEKLKQKKIQTKEESNKREV